MDICKSNNRLYSDPFQCLITNLTVITVYQHDAKIACSSICRGSTKFYTNYRAYQENWPTHNVSTLTKCHVYKCCTDDHKKTVSIFQKLVLQGNRPCKEALILEHVHCVQKLDSRGTRVYISSLKKFA